MTYYEEKVEDVLNMSDSIETKIAKIETSVGHLEKDVADIKQDIKGNSEKLDKISHKVYAAQIVLYVVGGLLSFLGTAAVYFLCSIAKSIIK
ncbi:MAG: hypothetical protein WC373_10750 [Smithella sp.]|jgi:t-SNARE complex subunit (syntaxin)